MNKVTSLLYIICCLLVSCAGRRIETEVIHKEYKTLCQRPYYLFYDYNYTNLYNYVYGYDRYEYEKYSDYPKTCTKGKFPIKNGYPVWLFDPDMDNYLGSFGVGKGYVRGGYDIQKQIAGFIARASLIKRINSMVEKVCNMEIERKISDEIIDNYKFQINCDLSHPSYDLIKRIILKDEWSDSKSGNVYIWMILERM